MLPPQNTILENDKVLLLPLLESDFDDLFAVASDPKIWEQHPNNDRWKKEVFKVFFQGALESNGAYKIVDKKTGNVIGSTRFYDFNEEENSILIGYTFFATNYWGKGFNQAVKSLMLNHIFQFVETVYFHVGADNIRSQIAVGRLGATQLLEESIAYFGDEPKVNVAFGLRKEVWKLR